MKKIFLILIAIFLISGCTQQQAIKEISIPGHGNTIYTFNNDIRDTLKMNVSEPEKIRSMFYSGKMSVVFDGSNNQENAYYKAILVDMGKIPTYLAFEGRLIKFQYYYFIGDEWHNETDEIIQKPNFTEPVLWLGVSNETEIEIKDNIVYLKGRDLSGLRIAGDRLALAVFGINKIEDIEKT
ncbi:MAG TPA: hypothetical protein VJB11_01885 [archaeon]|nr:hypothetical protein [archaeon]